MILVTAAAIATNRLPAALRQLQLPTTGKG
jgi:hypothetical protein